MKRLATALIASALAITITSCTSDDADEATETPEAAETTEATEATEAPEGAEAPEGVDTADPDLSGLDPLQLAAFDEAREEALAACLASTGELSQESCILVWNCAVNEVGVDAATDPAQEARLEEALTTCTAAIQ